MIEFQGGKWEGLEGLGEELLAESRPAAARAVKLAGLHLQNEVKRTLTGARSGRTYKVSKTGALHVASAPGEPPAVLFGNLKNSIGHSAPTWVHPYAVESKWGPGLGQAPQGDAPDPAKTYARRLEYGGVDSRGIEILPRPYLEPTEQRERPAVDRLLSGAGSR